MTNPWHRSSSKDLVEHFSPTMLKIFKDLSKLYAYHCDSDTETAFFTGMLSMCQVIGTLAMAEDEDVLGAALISCHRYAMAKIAQEEEEKRKT